MKLSSIIVLFVALGITGCTAPFTSQCGATIDWADQIQLNGIRYQANTTSVGRALEEADLGPQVASITFRVAGNVCHAPYQMRDGDAGFLDPGMPVYTVKNYSPEFQLAARRDNQLVVFEAQMNPRARQGSHLLDLKGKVRYIGINSARDTTREVAAITDQQQVEALIEMVLQAPLGQSPRPFDRRVYWIVFHFTDGRASPHGFNIGSGELSPGIVLPEAFGNAIEDALAASGARQSPGEEPRRRGNVRL